MKYTFCFLLIVVWFIVTAILVLSLIGNVALIQFENYWFSIIKSLLKVFEN